MGYRTVEKVPYNVRSYAQAKAIHDRITPIRGREPELKPLGNRRDCDTYWVRMEGEDVQFMLYRTPVITYKPDDLIHINTEGWDTVSTRQFIAHVLSVTCHGKGGKTVLRLRDKSYVVPQQGMVLKGEGGNLTVVSAPRLMGYRLNRTATANVRKRYAEFYQYMKTFITLRSSLVKNGRHEYEAVSYTIGEAAEVLGAEQGENRLYPMVNTKPWQTIACTPTEAAYNFRFKNNAEWELAYKNSVPKFLALIDGGERHEKHLDFHKAMLVLLTYQMTIYASEEHLTNVRGYECSGIRKLLESVLFRWFADEVVEKFELADGQVSTTNYGKWLKGE